MKTDKDYKRKNAPIRWAVLTNENIIMSADFISKEDAMDFRDNAYCGYYSDCEVRLLKNKTI